MAMNSFQVQVAKLALAAEATSSEAVQGPSVVTVPLTETAQSLPPHIIAATDPVKLNKQAPIFRCPIWADLPSRPFHLHCIRDKVPFPALGLHRFPYYLFGKNSVCDYVLEHPSISSVHAALIFNKEHACFVLLDLGSTNGVRLQGRRVEPRKPIPIAVGAIIQFGYSTRTYELRAGVPPALKRPRVDDDDGAEKPRGDSTPTTRVGGHYDADGKVTSAALCATVATSVMVPRIGVTSGSSGAAAASPKTDAQVKDSRPALGSPQEGGASDAPGDVAVLVEHMVEPAVAAAVTQAAPSEPSASPTEAVVAPAAIEYTPIHLFQLVIKHKDVENPVSRGHNKGEVITRSRADALDMARYILADHQKRVPADSALGFSPWTPEQFVAAVAAYCEVSSKKKRGDLGVVEKGTFADEIEGAAFRLRCGEVSAPVETQVGVHLLYRCD